MKSTSHLFRCYFTIALALAAVSAHRTVNADDVDLVILAGQSNMVGQANTTATIPGSDPADSQVQFYYDVTNTGGNFADDSGQTFGTLTPWQFNASTQRFGPEMSLGRDLVNVDSLNPALIKVASGGSNIARWLPPASIDYTKLVNAVTDGINEIQTAGDSVNLVGMVWLQGESDVINTTRANDYAANLDAFISGFRSQLDTAFPSLGFDEMRAFLVEPANWKNGSNPGIATQANIDTVHNALEAFATNDPNATFIPTDDLTVFEDNLIHFSSADQVVLGTRIADAIRQALIPEPTSTVLVAAATIVLAGRRRW